MPDFTAPTPDARLVDGPARPGAGEVSAPISVPGRSDAGEDRIAENVVERRSLGDFWSAALTGGTVWLLIRIGAVLFTVFMWMTVLPLTGKQLAPGKRGALSTYMDYWTNWDGAWYLQIAQNGYIRASAAFYPLFPLMIRGVGTLLHALIDPTFPLLSPLVWNASSLLVANACGLVALISVVHLVRQEGGDRAEVVAVVGALVAFPFAFFMIAGYTESLMVALTALTLLFARRRNWWAAAATAYLAALTHDPGILLAVPILWEFGASQHWWKALLRREFPRVPPISQLAAGTIAVLAAPLGTATFFAYLWNRFGTPFARLDAAGVWGRQLEAPWTTVSLVAHALAGANGMYWRAVTALDAGLFVLFVVVLALSVRRIPVSFVLFGFASLVLIALPIPTRAPDPLEATGRLLLGIVPIFLAFPRLTRRLPSVMVGCLVASALLQGAALTVWMTGGLIE